MKTRSLANTMIAVFTMAVMLVGYDAGPAIATPSLNVSAQPLTGDVTCNGATCTVNAVSGNSPVAVNAANLQFSKSVTASISQATPTSDVAPTMVTLSSQGPFASASTNTTSADLGLNCPSPVGAGNDCYIETQQGGTPSWKLGWVAGGTSNGAIYPGNVTPSASNYVLSMQNSGNNLGINAPTTVSVYTTGTLRYNFQASQIAPNADNTYALGTTAIAWTNVFGYSWIQGGTNPASAGAVRLKNNTAINARNQANGADITIAATDTSNNVSIGSGSNSVQILGPISGSATVPVKLATSGSTIACGTGGTQTISAAQAGTPGLVVTSGTLGSNCILDFGTNATSGWYVLDMSGVTLGATFGVQFKNGTSSSTVITSSNVLAGDTLAHVWTHGANTLAVQY